VRSPILAVVAAVAATLLAAPAAEARDCPDRVQAPNAVVLETTTGMYACARKADERKPVGSAMKLMTALLTLERADLDEVFRASSYRPAPIESQIGLRPGQRMSVRDLLRGLMMESGNDAAMTLAEGIAGSEAAFVRLMNQRARQLELRNTRYGNPIGLDEPGAYSSARDLVKLATYLRTKPFFRRLVNQESVTIPTGTFDNRNTLVDTVPWVNGVKTGHTRGAGYVLVGSGRQNGIQVVSAVLGTPSEPARNVATERLLEFGIDGFQRITAAPVRTPVEGATIPIKYRRGAELQLEIGFNGQRTVVPRGERDRVTIRALEFPDEVEGPIAYGQRLGRAEVLQDGERIAIVPLVASTALPAAGLAERTKSWFAQPLGIILAFAALTGTVLLARWTRRTGPRRRRQAREEATAA
jgi:serine-type D-Ala-D-Ala carboxypeptidase (penicillin-binding protein 5/6)